MTVRSNYIIISNILNRLTQLDPSFNFYHFGWRSDVDKAITNNFNVDANTGKMYPSVQWIVPEQSEWNMSDEYQQRENLKMCLYFDALQDYDNCGKPVKLTMLEQMQVLKAQAQNFVINFNKVLCHYGLGQIQNKPIIELDSYSHKDRVIVCKICFDLDFIAECPELLDISSFPDDLEVCDLENYCDCIQQVPPEPPTSVLNSFVFDGVNEYIQTPVTPSLDFDYNETFSISIWVKNVSSSAFLIGKSNVAVTKAYFVRLVGNLVAFSFTNSPQGFSIRTVASLDTSVWNHIIVTNDLGGGTANMKIYINGVLQPTTIVTLPAITSSIKNTSSLFLGGLSVSNLGSFTCANARLWNIKLDAADVLEEYNSGVVRVIPTQGANCVYNPDFDNATWDGLQWNIPDLTGVTAGYTSINMEEADRISDVPS